MAISSTRTADLFKTVRRLLNSNKTLASGCYAAFPEDDVTYPFYVVEYAGDDPNWKTPSTMAKNTPIDVLCFADNMKALDEIADEAEHILLNNKATLSASGLAQADVVQSNTNHPILNNKVTHVRIATLTGEWTGDR